MKRLSVLLSALLLAGLSLLAAPAGAAESAFPTPEDAITAYLAGVKAQDFKAVYATTAADAMSKGFDFVSYVDRLRVLTPQSPAPAGTPFFVAINRAQFAAQIARQLQGLVYGLTTESPVLDGRTMGPLEAADAEAFMAAAAPARLGGLELVKIGTPNPTIMNGERNVANFARGAAVYGAEEGTERVALVAFEGRHFMVGFGLLRFGDTWLIERQSSYLADTGANGAPRPITPEQFELVLQ